MERRGRVHLLTAAAALIAMAMEGRVLLTREKALAGAFPAGVKVQRQSVFLTTQQIAVAKRESGLEVRDHLLIRYAGSDGRFAYFDSHRVRTLAETVMIVVSADARIERIEILSFDEPSDYFPKRRWLDQLLGRRLDRDLALDGAIRPISGASLTARAIVNASRRILALHRAIGTVVPR